MTPLLLTHWVRQEIRELSAYETYDHEGFIKLDAMENPYPWPKLFQQALMEKLHSVAIHRYPDPEARTLKQRIRQVLEVPTDSHILLGNGSDELIQILLQAIAAPNRTVLAPEPGFSMYRIIARGLGLHYVGISLTDPFELDQEAMLQAIEEHQPAAIFLAYPNNPTGNLFDRKSILEILAKSSGVVVLDEAYFPFSGKTFLSELTRYPNLVILRTFSKIGLAGLRLGVLIGEKTFLKELNKIRLPYNINGLTQASADFMLSHQQVLTEQVGQICADRTWLTHQLNMLDNITVYPSEANFILIRPPQGSGERLFNRLKSAGILVKYFREASTVLQDCLRVTIGHPEENRAFLTALSAALSPSTDTG